MQPARGVDDDDVAADGPGFGERALGARHRIHLAGRIVHSHARLLRDDRQLLDGGRAPNVGRNDDRMASLFRQPLRELAGRRGLARALQAEHQDHARPRRRFLQPALGIAEQREQLIPDDLDDLLRRVQTLLNLAIHRAIAHAIDECLDDLEVDVGFEQRQADLAKHPLNRGLCESGFSLE